MIPSPPLPGQDPRPFFIAIAEAISQLQLPGRPQPACPLLSTDLPAAADFIHCIALATDLKVLVASDGAAWIRQDTGAPV